MTMIDSTLIKFSVHVSLVGQYVKSFMFANVTTSKLNLEVTCVRIMKQRLASVKKLDLYRVCRM